MATLWGLGVATAGAEGASEPDSAAIGEPRGFDRPTWVMARSLVVPGWGQLKNGAWWKAILVAGIEGALVERLCFEDRLAGAFRRRAERVDPESEAFARLDWKAEKHRRHRRDFIWWTSLFVLLSMGDAYVDAHLKRFDVELQIEPGAVPTGSEAQAPATAMRIGLAWRP